MTNVVFYRCEECGNVVALLGDKGGALDCCEQNMTKLTANTTDAAQEKHVPIVTKEGGKVKSVVGSVIHPMLPEHHIEWIALAAKGKMQFVFLEPGMEPKADFEDVDSGSVYEYCNLHGLWKSDF